MSCIRLQLCLAFSTMNIFTLILDIPKEACSMYSTGLIDPRQGEYSHPFPVSCKS